MSMPYGSDPIDGSARQAGPTSNADVPVCPRHPDTVTYVRCQRCNRPTCPACQRQASVGVQCVDCVNAEARSTPAPRSAVGLTAVPGRPLVTMAIIAICALVWVGEMSSLDFFGDVAFIPLAAKTQPWRFITSGFAHSASSPFHLMFNMYALYVVGQYLEPLLGRMRFAALYLLSVLGGSVGYELLTSPPVRGGDLYASGWAQPLVGASGGVFGLFLAIVVLNRHLGREIRPMLTLIGINVVLGFAMPNVAWQAHLGGAVAGAAGAGLLYALRRRPAAVQFAALALAAAVLVGVAYARFAMVDLSWLHVLT